MSRRKDSLKAPEEAPIWGRLVRAVDPETGEEFVGWRAYQGFDADEMRRRGYRVGQELSTEFRMDRNLKNYRQAHALAQFVRDNTEAFPADLDTHAVLKRIQVEGDIECDLVEEDAKIEGLGWIQLKRKVPRSFRFSEMPQEIWRRAFTRLKDYCIQRWFPDWGPDEIAQFEEILRGNQPP